MVGFFFLFFFGFEGIRRMDTFWEDGNFFFSRLDTVDWLAVMLNMWRLRCSRQCCIYSKVWVPKST